MGALNYEEENEDKSRIVNLKEVYDPSSSNIQDEMRLALLKVAGNYTLDNARYLTKQLNDYLSKLPKGNESNEETFKLALEKFFSVHFFCCEVAKITKQYVLDYNLKVALSTLISIRLFSAQGLSPNDEAYKAIKRQIKSIMFTVYIRYFCYLTGKFSCVGVSELVSQFVSHELSSSVSNFVKEIEEEFSKNPPPAPEHSKLFYFSNYPIIDLAKVEVIDISDNSDNEEVWHRFEKLKVENEVKRREARKRPITKTKLKVGSVICISDDEEMPPQSLENSRENGVERAAKVITEASGLLSKFMDMNSSSKLTLRISKEELSLHIDPGSPERRSSSDEDLQRSHFPLPQYPYNPTIALRGDTPIWAPNAPPYVLSTADGRCYYTPCNAAEFSKVPLESNNINRHILNTPTANQNLDRTSMKGQENRCYLWPSQQYVEEKNCDPSRFFPQENEYYEEYRENNNLPTPVIMPQLEVAVLKTESVDVANSPEAVIVEEVPLEHLAEGSVQLVPEGTSIIAAQTTSAMESIKLSSLENDPEYVAGAPACGNLLLLSQVITDIVSSMSSPKNYEAMMDSDENLNLNENKTLVFEPPSLTYIPEQLMLMKEDSTKERDDPMKYIIAVKNSVESDGCDDDGLLNLSSTGEAQEVIKPAYSELKAGKPQSDSFPHRPDSAHQRDTCIRPLKPARVPDSYLQDPRISLLQYEATNDCLRLETTDSSDSEIVLKIDDYGVSSPENPDRTETKASPSLVYCPARKTIKTCETKAEQKEDVVKVPSDESEDDLPLQYRLIKYQHLNQGKSTTVSPLKRSYKKGRLAQNEGKRAGKKRRHNDDSTRFYTLKLRSYSKSFSKKSEVRTTFRSRGRPRKKPSRVRGKTSKVSKPAVDKPKKSANLSLVEETPISPSFSLEETYSLATTPPKKMFLFSFLRKTNKPLEDTTLMLLERQTSHTVDSGAQDTEKSPGKTEPMETLDLEKRVQNIKCQEVCINNAKEEETIYANIPNKKLFRHFEAVPSELNIPMTILENSTIVTARRNFNEIAVAYESEEVALDVSIAGADAFEESTAADIPQIVVQKSLENATPLIEPKKGEILIEFSANPAKQQQVSVVNYLEDGKLESAALAEEHSSESFLEAETFKVDIRSISDNILHSTKSKSAESIPKKRTKKENSVEIEVAEKSVLEENLKKLKKVSIERRPEEVSEAFLNPKSKIHTISNQILTGFEAETNTKGVCENHMELEPQKLPQTSESSSVNSTKSEIKINVSDEIILGCKSGSGSSKEERVEVLEKLVETTKEMTLGAISKKNNEKKVYFGKVQEISKELVIHHRKTEKVSNKSNGEGKKYKDIINGHSTTFPKVTHVNLTEDEVLQQRKNRRTSDQVEKSIIEGKKSKQVTFEKSTKSSDDVAKSVVEIEKCRAASEDASERLVTQQKEGRENSEQTLKPDNKIDKSVKVTIEDCFESSDEARKRYAENTSDRTQKPHNEVGSAKERSSEPSEVVLVELKKPQVASEDLVIHQRKSNNTSDQIQKSNKEIDKFKEVIIKNCFKPSEEPPENHVKLKESQEPSEVASEDLFAQQRKKIKISHQSQKSTKGLEGSVKPCQNAIKSHVELKKYQGMLELVSEDGVTHQNRNEKSNNEGGMSKEVIIEETTFENRPQLSMEANQGNIESEESLKVPEVASEYKEIQHSIGITIEDSSKSSKAANKSHITLKKPQKAANSIQNDQTVKEPESSWNPSEGPSNNFVEPEKCLETSKNHVKVFSEEAISGSSLLPSRIDLDKTEGPCCLQSIEGAQNTEKMLEKSVELPSYGKIHIISDRILRGSMAKFTDNPQEINKSENALNVEFLSRKNSEDSGVASKEPEKKIIIISDWTLRGARTKITESSWKRKEPDSSTPQIEKAVSGSTKAPETRNWRQEREKSFDAIAARALQKTKLWIQTSSNAEIALKKEEEIRKLKATEEIGKPLSRFENSNSDATPVRRLPQAEPELCKAEDLDFLKARKDELKVLDIAGKTENTETQIADRYHPRRTLEDVLRLNSSQPEVKPLANNLRELSDSSAFRQMKKEAVPSVICEELDKNLDVIRRETSRNWLKQKQPKKGSPLEPTKVKSKSKSPGNNMKDAILKVKHQIELKQDANAHKEAMEERLFRIDNEKPEPLVPDLDSEILMIEDWSKSAAGSNGGTKTLQIDFRKMAVKPLPRMLAFDTYLDKTKQKRHREELQIKGPKFSLNVPIEFMQFERDSGEFVSSDKLKQIYKLEEGINAGNEFTFRLKNRDVKGHSLEEVKSSSRGKNQSERTERKREDLNIQIPWWGERGRQSFKSLESKREACDQPKNLKCYEPEVNAERRVKKEKDDTTFQNSTEEHQRKVNRKFGRVYGRYIREDPKCKGKEDANKSRKSYKEKRGDENLKLGTKESEEGPENDTKSTVLLCEPSAVTELKHEVDKMKESTSERTSESSQKDDLGIINFQQPSKLKDQEGTAKTIDVKPWLSKRPLTKAALKDMSQIPQRNDVESGEVLLTKIQPKAVGEVETLDKIKDVKASLSKRPVTKAALKEMPRKLEKAHKKADEVDIEEVPDKGISIILIDERDQKPPHTMKIDMRTLEKAEKFSQEEKSLDAVLEAKASSSGLKKTETEELLEDISSNLKVQRYEESLKEPRIDVTLNNDPNIKLKQELILEPDFTVVESIIAQKDIGNSQELSVPLLQVVDEEEISEHIQDAFSYLVDVAKSASEPQSVPHELLPSPLLLETALKSSQCLQISQPGKDAELQPSEQPAHQLNSSDSTLEPLINLESTSKEFYIMLDKDQLTSQVNRKRKFTEQYTCEKVKKPMLLDKPDELKKVDMMSSEDVATFDGLEEAFLKEQDKACHTLVVGDCLVSQHKFFSAEHEYYSGITDTVETTPILNFNFDQVEDAESVATTLSEPVSSTAAFPSSFQVFGHSNTEEPSQADGLRSGDNEEKWVVRYYCPEDVGQIWSEYLQGEDQSKIETDQYETMDKMIGESQPREDVLEAPDINLGADALGDANWTFLDNYMEELVIEDQVSVPFDIDDKPSMQPQTPDKKNFVNSGITAFPEPVGTNQPFPMHDVYFDAEFQHAVGIGLLNNLPDSLNQGKKSAEVPMLKSAKEDFVSSLNFNIAAINNIMEFSQPTTFPDLNFSDTQLLLNNSPEAPVETGKTAVVASSSDTSKPSETIKSEPKSRRSKSPKKTQHIVSFLRASRNGSGNGPPPSKIGVNSTTDISMRNLVIGSREVSENSRVHRSMNHYQPAFPVTVVDEDRSSEPPLKSAKGKRVTQSPKSNPQDTVQPILFDEPSLRLKTRSSMRQYTRKFASDSLSSLKTGSKASNPIKLRQSKKNVKPADIDPFDVLKNSPNMNLSFEQQQAKKRGAVTNEKSPRVFDAKQPNSSSVSWSPDRGSQSQAKP